MLSQKELFSGSHCFLQGDDLVTKRKQTKITNIKGSKKNKYHFKIAKSEISPRCRVPETLKGYAGNSFFVCLARALTGR